MANIRQANFNMGEVDSVNTSATNAPQYLQALLKCKNAVVNSQTKIEKRGALVFENALVDTITISDTKHKSIAFQSNSGTWFQADFYIQGGKLICLLVKYFAGKVSEAITVTSIATTEDISKFSLTATNDYIVIANQNIPPQRLTITEAPKLAAKVEAIAFSVVPALDFNNIDYSSYHFTPSGNPNGATVTVNTAGVTNPQFFTSEYVGGAIVGGGASVEQPIGYGLITKVNPPSGTSQTLEITVLSGFAKVGDISTAGTAWSVREPVWSPAKGYPTVCAFHRSRLWFAATKTQPLLIAGSKENTPNNFNVNIGQPVDAICYLMNSAEGGKIVNLFSGLNLHIWTKQSQYIVTSGLDTGITPSNFDPKPASSYTVSDMEPLQYRDNIYFCTSNGKSIIEVVESSEQSESVDISFSSSHLVNNPIKAQVSTVDDTQEQYAYFWSGSNSITIFSKSAIAEVTAFTSLTFNLPGNLSILTFDNVDNKLFFILRNSNGKIIIASLSSEKTLDVEYPVKSVGGNMTTPTFMEGTVSLISKKQGAIQYYGDYEIKNNTIAAKVLDGDYFIGYKYPVSIQSMPLFLTQDSSFYKKKISQIFVEYFDSYDFTINNKKTALNTLNDLANKFLTLKTGISRIGYSNSYQQENSIQIKQESPYPLTIQSMGWVTSGAIMA